MTARPDLAPDQDAATDDGENRRIYQRALKELTGCLLHGDKEADCLILDLSASGAKVQIDGQVYSEDGTFNLSLAEKLKIAAPVDLPVEVVWQRGSVAGLRFLRDPAEIAQALESLLPEELLVPEKPLEK